MSATADHRARTRGDTQEAAGAKSSPIHKVQNSAKSDKRLQKAPCLRTGADEPIDHYAAPVEAQAQAF